MTVTNWALEQPCSDRDPQAGSVHLHPVMSQWDFAPATNRHRFPAFAELC
jgi:hypothetical protein